MKKVVNSVLASALALTVAPMVVGAEEAATTTAPQIDPALDKVVKRLSALGLVEGMGNGDMALGQNVTRAQFATLVVRARGLASGVPLAQNEARFADIKTADWFSGWVNVAAGQELVKGYPNNSFGPANNVTYAEAVAMIIRALGYDIAVKGVWPNNYIAKAAELGISDGVHVDPNKPATRGDIFMMLDNSLNVDLMKQNEYGAGDLSYTIETDKTLLTEYLNVDVYDMDWSHNKNKDDNDLPFVSNVPVSGLGTLKANEVSFLKQSGSPISGTFKVADGINPNDFAGQHVQVWVKDDREDTIVWMEASDNEEVVFDQLDTMYYDNKIVKPSTKIDGKDVKFWDQDRDLDEFEVKMANGKTYKFSDDLKVSYNYKRFSKWEDAFKAIGIDDDAIDSYSTKLVLDDNGDISYMAVVDDISADNTASKSSDLKFGSEVIKKVDLDKKRIYTLDGKDVELKDDEEGKDFIVFRNGQPAKLADLKEMDVYSVYFSDGNQDKKIIVANSTVVEGKVDSVEYTKSNKSNNNYLKIGDKKYRIRSASFSDDHNKTVDTWGDDEADKFKDLDGLSVKLYLDTTGRVRHIETNSSVKERTITGVVTKDIFYDEGKDTYSLQVYNEKGAKKTLEVTDEDDFKGFDGNTEIMNAFTIDHNDPKPIIVQYELDSNDKVKEVKLVDDSLHTVALKDWDDAADEDDLTVRADGESFHVNDDAVVFDLMGDVEQVGASKRYEWKNVGLGKFKTIADDDYKVLFHEKNGDIDYMYVVDGTKSIASEGEYGVVNGFSSIDGDDYVRIITKDGSEKQYKLDGTVDEDDDFERFDTIRYELNSDNELVVSDSYRVVATDGDGDNAEGTRFNKDFDEDDIDSIVAIRVDDVDGTKITYKDANDKKHYYYTTSSTVYFDQTGPGTKSDVTDGDYVILIDTDDSGTAADYVVFVTDQDTVDDNGYDMDGFLAQTVIVDPDPDPETGLFEDGATAAETEVVPGLISNYTVSAVLASHKADQDVEVTIGSKKVTVKTEANGKLEFSKQGTPGLSKITLTVDGEDFEIAVK